MTGHGRYPYRPVTEPVPYVWPEGEGLAAYLAVNLEAYAFDAALLDELVHNPARPDVINYAWLDRGNRVGAWRLLAAMQEAGVPATALVDSLLYGAAPGLVEAYRAAGRRSPTTVAPTGRRRRGSPRQRSGR